MHSTKYLRPASGGSSLEDFNRPEKKRFTHKVQTLPHYRGVTLSWVLSTNQSTNQPTNQPNQPNQPTNRTNRTKPTNQPTAQPTNLGLSSASSSSISTASGCTSGMKGASRPSLCLSYRHAGTQAHVPRVLKSNSLKGQGYMYGRGGTTAKAPR